MKFKVGDTALCIHTEGWGGRRWNNGKSFKVQFKDLKHLNFSYPEDFIKINSTPKKIQQYGIVNFLQGIKNA